MLTHAQDFAWRGYSGSDDQSYCGHVGCTSITSLCLSIHLRPFSFSSFIAFASLKRLSLLSSQHSINQSISSTYLPTCCLLSICLIYKTKPSQAKTKPKKNEKHGLPHPPPILHPLPLRIINAKHPRLLLRPVAPNVPPIQHRQHGHAHRLGRRLCRLLPLCRK